MELRVLYFTTVVCAAAVTAGSLPLLCRFLAPFLSDTPGGLKKHIQAVPMLGGCAIFAGTLASMILLRLITNFPTGTLHSLRGILSAGSLIFLLGLIDDIRKPKGLPIALRLFVQAAASALLIYYGVYVQICSFNWLNYIITFLWLLTLTNAFNLLDIQDGLCVTQAIICAGGLALIALPAELWYVNFAALALMACGLAFWPFNHCKKKVFLGDSGATFLGFMIAAISMGTQYTRHNMYGYTAALFITAVPLLDTTFVSVARLLQGKNPLRGSDDHLALQLKKRWHLSTPAILTIFAVAALLCNWLGYVTTKLTPIHTQALCVLSLLAGGMCLVWLLQKLSTSIR